MFEGKYIFFFLLTKNFNEVLKNCVLIFNFFLLMHMNLTNLTIIISLPSF